jgi:hypothetical protein
MSGAVVSGHRKAGIAGLVVALAVGLAACKPAPRGVVTLIGDSNLTNSAAWLVDAFNTRDNGYVEYVLATSGTTIRFPDCAVSLPPNTVCTSYNFWKVRLATAWPRVNTDVIVVELGINDAGQLGTPDSMGYSGYDAKVDWFMGLLPPNKPVLWTNLPCVIEPTSENSQFAGRDFASAA